MGATPLEVAEIFRRYVDLHRQQAGGLAPHQERVVRALTLCRTAELGGHLYVCDQCGIVTERYNSCRNRHCPKCQFLERTQWLEDREAELLPVSYFHLVFTVPEAMNPVFLRNPRTLYGLLFRAAGETLLQIAADPKHLGAKLGVLAVLHTWGQRLQLHPHIHCIVPGGGLAPAGDRWISSREDFFLPVRVLARLFRGKLLDALRRAVEQKQLRLPDSLDPVSEAEGYRSWLDQLYGQEWVVHGKRPFGGSQQGLSYLARYTHRVAISNHRLVKLEDDRVYFHWRDYRDGGEQKVTHLHGVEFVRRYLLHVLPPGFQRIRYYGLLA